MRKIALISDARTSHGIYTPVLRAIEKDPEVNYMYILCGMHLSKEFGHTIDTVKSDGWTPTVMNVLPEGNSGADQARFIGKAIVGLTEIFERDRPDIVLAQGDRGISVASAIAPAHMGIPVIHMHGGEVSGTIDECARHAITKYSHIHFAASVASAERIYKLGEDRWRIHAVGAAGIEIILNQEMDLMTKEETASFFGYDPNKPLEVVLQHPVTDEVDMSRDHMKITLESLESLGHQVVIIYPNSDAGREGMIEEIESAVKRNQDRPYFKSFPNIPYLNYLSLLKHASVLIGNSSGGIIEAPSLGLPVVNVGTRQQGRERAQNIIDVEYDREQIKRAVNKALFDEDFKRLVAERKTPYDPHGDGKISERMVDILKNVEIDEKLMDKVIRY
jgi:GDP/UDP-N,N'-diacetylbacillosamine 2-epimerase (hydrolysing)